MLDSSLIASPLLMVRIGFDCGVRGAAEHLTLSKLLGELLTCAE